MTITVELPDDLKSRPNFAREAIEAFAIEGFRSGAFSIPQMRTLLGFETRYELDGFLKAHEVFERSYGVGDFEQDLASIRRMELAGLIKP